ncbi:MAG: hypothetical protein ACWGMZ_11290 [Thermoguttaceae bacterium]
MRAENRTPAMIGNRAALALISITLLFAIGGASCPNMVRQPAPVLPRILPVSPTLQQVMQVVNGNNSRIQSFWTDQATISGPGFPVLRTSIAFQRPKLFRLQASSGLTGPEVDLGSNNDIFWYWIRHSEPPAIYYCRHDQFAVSPARYSIPIQPAWLIEALGVSELDPNLPHQGPFPLQGGRLEVRTIRETPDGPTTKVTILDGSQGWILEQNIYNAQGSLLASAVASQHRRDPLSGLVMPGVVVINCPAARFTMRIDLGAVQINRLSGNPCELWTMPTIAGTPAVDLAHPPNCPPVAQGVQTPGVSAQPPARQK